MQALISAKSEAALLAEEVDSHKMAVKDLQKDMQRMQDKYERQLTRIKASKFPVAQVMLWKHAIHWPLQVGGPHLYTLIWRSTPFALDPARSTVGSCMFHMAFHL